MLLLSEWQNEPQPCRSTDPVRITLWVIRRVINTFRPQKIHVCVYFFFWKERNLTISFQGPDQSWIFFPVTKPTQESTWSIRRVMHWGHLHGDRAVHRVCFQHETTAVLLHFLTYSHLKDFLWENPGVFQGHGWPLFPLLPGRGVSSIGKGEIFTSCKHRRSGPTYNTDMWALRVPTRGHIRKKAFA